MELQRRMLLTIFRKELSYAIVMCPHLVGLYVECFMNVNVWLQHLKYNVQNVRQIVEIIDDSCIYGTFRNERIFVL